MSNGMSVGCDVVSVQRLQQVRARCGADFDADLFSPSELQWMATAEHAAQCFAIKEACMKALGYGIGHGLSPRQFEVDAVFNVQVEALPKVKLIVHSRIENDHAIAVCQLTMRNEAA